MKNSFLIYHEYKEILEDLTDEELGILFRAVFDYEISGILPNFTGLLKMAFRIIQGNLDRDRAKYDKRCETSIENGKLGGRPRKGEKPKKPNEKPKKPKKADNDNETEDDIENDTEDESDAVEEESETNADLFTFVQKAFGRTLNSIEYETISTWKDNDLTRYAVKESILNGARGIRYIETVLSSWKSKGFKTIQEVQAYQKKYKKSKTSKKENVPEWFEKDIPEQRVTKEEQEEAEKILKEIGEK